MKNWGKRAVALLLMLSMVFEFVGCANNGTDTDESTSYYEVTYALPDGVTDEEKANIELPESGLVEEGTMISALPTPDKWDSVFTGWYYDSDCTLMAGSDDVVDQDLTLYPGFGAMNGMDGAFSINYVSDTDVDEDYEVFVTAYGLTQEQVLANLAVRDMSLGGEDMEFTVEETAQEEKTLDLDNAGLDENTLRTVKKAIADKQARSSVSLYDELSALGLDEDLFEQILEEYAPDELEEHYLAIELPSMSQAELDALKEEGIDLANATEEDLRKAYSLSDEESIEEFWRESLLYEPEEIMEMTSLLKKNEADRMGDGSRFIVKPADGKWNAGDLHQVEILDTENMRFYYHGADTDESVIYLNFSVYHAQTFHLQLEDGIVFIPFSEVSGIELENGIYTVIDENGTGNTEQRMDSGVMTWSGGSLEAGQTIAVYDGTLNEDGTVDGSVGYYVITEVKGGNSYAYNSADYEDIIFTPDVLPIRDDGSFEDHRITLTKAETDFSGRIYDNFNLDETTSVDVGDFIAFYTGNLSNENSLVSVGYGRITALSEDGGNLTVTYEEVTQSDVLNGSEMYLDYDNVEVPLDDDTIESLETSMVQQAEESDFFHQSGEYLAAVLTDQEYDLDNYEYADELKDMTFQTQDGTTITLDELQEMASGGSKVEVSDPQIAFNFTTKLDHFDGSGIRGVLSASFTVSITLNTVGSKTNKLEITCSASLEQEIVLGLHVSSETQWKWYAFIPVIKEISVTAAFRAGTYTGFGASCSVKTTSESNNKDKAWDELIQTNNNGLEKETSGLTKMAEKLGTLVGDLKKIQNGVTGSKEKGQDGKIDNSEVESTSAGGTLQEKYSSMLSNDAQYITLLDKNLFTTEVSPDPLHLLCFSFGADFVVSVKINAMLGFGISYANAKQYSFSFKVFEGTSESSTADLETPNFRADFYAFGMIGVRAGVLLDVRVGLISTKMDSIGVTAEAGLYAELYGFLYVYYSWESGKGSDWGAQGSLLFEIGIYLNINFKAQLGDGKLGTTKPIYTNKWPLVQLGAVSVPLDFSTEDGDSILSVEIPKSKNTVKLNSDVFKMSMMKLSSGKTEDVQEDTAEVGDEAYTFTINNRTYTQYNEKNFSVACYDLDGENGKVTSTKSFLYLPATDEIYVKPANSSVTELWGEVVFTYRNHSFGFDTRSIQKTVKVHWKGVATSAEVEYYLEQEDGSYVLSGTGAFDGFDGVEYDLIVDKDFTNQFQGYRLASAVFPDEQKMKDKVQEAYDTMEAAGTAYYRNSTAENYSTWTKATAAFMDLHNRLDNYGSNISNTIRDQSGTLYFMMVSNETIVKLYFNIESHYVYAFNMEDRNNDSTFVYLYGFDYTQLRQGDLIRENMPDLMVQYERNTPGVTMEWYYYVCGEDGNQLSDAMAHKDEWKELTADTRMPDAEVYLIGYHTPNNFTVTWMDGDTVLRTDTVDYEASIPTPPTAEKDGYYISAWTTADEDVREISYTYIRAADTMPDHDVTYTAQWTGVEQNIIWKVSGIPSVFTRIRTGEPLLDYAPEVEAQEGYTLVWYVKTDSGEVILDNDVPAPANGITIYGKWVENTCTVQWVTTDSEGNPIVLKEENLAKGSLLTPPDVTVEGTGELVWMNSDDQLITDTSRVTGDMVIRAYRHEHVWDAGRVTKAATCAEEGTNLLTCTLCGMTRTESIAKTEDHTWTRVSTTAATCVNTGSVLYRCTVCGEEKTETLPIDPNHHSASTYMGTAILPTCVTPGKQADWYCSDCGAVVREGAVIPATGNHTYVYVGTQTASTCSVRGTDLYRCSVCQAETLREHALNPDNHTGNTEIINAAAATCGASGYTGDTVCSDCHVTLSTGSVIPATGNHTDGTPTVITPATCNTTGLQQVTCTVCGSTRNQTIPIDPDNHTGSTSLVNVRAATCIAEGYTGDTICDDCGAVLSAGASIPRVGTAHTWNAGVHTGASAAMYEMGDAYYHVTLIPEKTVYTCTGCADTEEEVTNFTMGLDADPRGGDHIAYLSWEEIEFQAGYRSVSTLEGLTELLNDGRFIGTVTVSSVENLDSGTTEDSAMTLAISSEMSFADESASMTIEDLSAIFAADPNARVAVTIHVVPTYTDASTQYLGRYDHYDIYGDLSQISAGDVTIYIEGHTHTWDGGEVYQKHTDTEDGSYIYHCTVDGCSAVYYETMPAGHDGGGNHETVCVQDANGLYLGEDGNRYNIEWGNYVYDCWMCGDTITEPDKLVLRFYDDEDNYFYQTNTVYLCDLMANGITTLGDLTPELFGAIGYTAVPLKNDPDTTIWLKPVVTWSVGSSTGYSDATTLASLQESTETVIWLEFDYTVAGGSSDRFEVYPIYIRLTNDRMDHSYHSQDSYAYNGDKCVVTGTTLPYYENGTWVAGTETRTCQICGQQETVKIKLDPSGLISNTTIKTQEVNGITYPTMDTHWLSMNLGANSDILLSDAVFGAPFYVTVYYSASGTYDAANEECVSIPGTLAPSEEYLADPAHNIYIESELPSEGYVIVPYVFTPSAAYADDFNSFEVELYLWREPYV